MSEIEKLKQDKTNLRSMLSRYRCAQSRMLDDWSEASQEKKHQLWKDLHGLEHEALDVLEKTK